MSAPNRPRYKNNPVYLFFESYIQDVVGQLDISRKRSTAMQATLGCDDE